MNTIWVSDSVKQRIKWGIRCDCVTTTAQLLLNPSACLFSLIAPFIIYFLAGCPFFFFFFYSNLMRNFLSYFLFCNACHWCDIHIGDRTSSESRAEPRWGLRSLRGYSNSWSSNSFCPITLNSNCMWGWLFHVVYERRFKICDGNIGKTSFRFDK